MNKKFLSAILFGALMVTSTGTFVSCKDYDDDIENLQEQINKLATKEDMTSQIASLQSALSAAAGEAAAAKTAAQNALDKATASEKAAAQAALDAAAAKTEAIKAAQEEVAKVKAELEASVDAKFEANKKELAATIAKLTEKVEEMTGYTTKMVTDINLEYVYPANGGEDQNGRVLGAFDEMLDLNYAKVKTIKVPKGLKDNTTADPGYDEPSSYEFGKGMPGAFTVNKGDVNTVQDNFLINVAPVNAAIPAESLSLINSKGEDLNEYVDVTISNYDGLLTGYGYDARGLASTGLRQVGVQLKNTVDFESFDKMVIADEGYEHNTGDNDEFNCSDYHEYILHALAATDSKGRAVNSEFDLKFHVQKEAKADAIPVFSYLSSSAYVGKSQLSNHMVAYDGYYENGAFPIVLNDEFTLEVGSVNGRVMASYVELDPENPRLSETDKKALKLITVSGDKKVVKNGVHNLAVGGDAEGMPVPFKLVTIDYLGNVTVVPFWVMAETPALMSATFTVTPSSYVEDATAYDAVSAKEEFKVPATAETFTINLKACETAHQGYGYNEFIEDGEDIANITNYFNFYDGNKVETTYDKAVYAEFKGELNLNVMREDKAYEGVIKFYAENGSFLASNDIAVKKVLPTAIPVGLTAKTNAIHADGTLPVYPTPTNDGATGKYELSNSFNFNFDYDADGEDDVDLTKLTFKTPSFKTNATYNGFVIENIKKAIIDGTTKFPTTVEYNYGDIKYHAEGHGVEAPEEYVVEWATKFSIQFGCVPAASTYAWYTAPTVYYQEETLVEAYNATEKKYYNFMTVKNPYGKTIDAFDSTDEDWTTWAEALNTGVNTEVYLLTNDNRKNEFFTAAYEVSNGKTALKLTPIPSVTTVLEADVETTVVLVITDKFGHKHEVKALTFTMKKDRK